MGLLDGLKREAKKADYTNEVRRQMKSVSRIPISEEFLQRACWAIPMCFGLGVCDDLMPGDWRVWHPTVKEFCDKYQLGVVAERRKAARQFPFDDSGAMEQFAQMVAHGR